MHRRLFRLLSAMFVIASLSISAHASDFPAFSPIPVGYVSFDVTGTNVAQFDIVNFTGPNASTFPDMTFPIATSLSLHNLSLTVDYSGGQSKVFGSSYFTLDSDGLSFDGEQLSTLSGYPTGLFDATSAILTGTGRHGNPCAARWRWSIHCACCAWASSLSACPPAPQPASTSRICSQPSSRGHG